MKTVAIIQARSGSSRLPNKAMLELGGMPMIGWVIERVKRFSFVNQVCVATTEFHEDDVIEQYCKSLGVVCVRESKKLGDGRNDVLSRFVKAAALTDAEHIVRITADCPFISPALAAEVWHRYSLGIGEKGGPRYTSNVIAPLDGFDVEIFSRDMLKRANEALLSDDRHHVTSWIRARTETHYVEQAFVWNRKLSIDSPNDYMLARKIVAGLECDFEHPVDAEWCHVISEADSLLSKEGA